MGLGIDQLITGVMTEDHLDRNHSTFNINADGDIEILPGNLEVFPEMARPGNGNGEDCEAVQGFAGAFPGLGIPGLQLPGAQADGPEGNGLT